MEEEQEEDGRGTDVQYKKGEKKKCCRKIFRFQK